MEKDTDNQNKVLLPNEMIIETVDGKLCRSIGNENSQEIWVQNVFDTPMGGMLLSWNLQTTWRKRNNLLFYIMAFNFGITPGPLLMDLLKTLTSGMVMEDHGSTRGVILGISEPYNDGTTTILLGTLSKRYELSDKLISDRRTHSVLHKSEQLFGFKLTTNRPHYPWNYRTYNFRDMEITLSYTLLQQETTYYLKNRTAEIEEASTETRKTFIRHQNLTFPIIHHHNMFLRKTKSTP